jgi:hypothetical protein
VRVQILPMLATLALLASSGAGGGLLHLCSMGGNVKIGCCCPHSEGQDSCATLRVGCCELREVPGPPGSAPATAQDANRDGALVPAWVATADLTPLNGASRAGLPYEWEVRSRAGPPIFRQVCAYLN